MPSTAIRRILFVGRQHLPCINATNALCQPAHLPQQHVPTSRSICLSIYLSAYPSMYTSIHVSIYLTIYPSIYPSINLSTSVYVFSHHEPATQQPLEAFGARRCFRFRLLCLSSCFARTPQGDTGDHRGYLASLSRTSICSKRQLSACLPQQLVWTVGL